MLVTAAVLAASAHAVRTALSDSAAASASRDAVCPVCDHAFEVVVRSPADRGAGISRDLMPRAVRAQPICFLVHTCPRCFYSGYLDDFQVPGRVDDALRSRVLRAPGLRPATPISATMSQHEIPVTTRYALAAQVYEWRGASAEARAWLALRWAWVVRDEGSFVPPTPLMIRAMREIERRLPEWRADANQADRELQAAVALLADHQAGHYAGPLEAHVRLAIATVLRRQGELRPADTLLAGLLDDSTLEGNLPAVVRRMRASIVEERRLLGEARGLFQRAVSRGDPKPENLAAACYLLGEICRRLEDDAAARDWYDRALRTDRLDSALRRWATQQRELLVPAGAASDAGAAP